MEEEEEEKEIIEEEEIVSKEDIETQIKLKMLDEPDWRKRAAMAAMIISKSLE